MWARATMRSHRRSLVGLALLLGLVGTIVLGAAAGARRTASASDRFRERTSMPEGFLNVESLLNSGTTEAEVAADLDEVAELPGVIDIAPFAFMAVMPLDDTGEQIGFGSFAPTDERLGTTVARTLVRDGRAPDPTRADEVGINQALADTLGIGPGDHVTLATVADYATGEPGEDVVVTVTGIELGIFDLLNEGPIVHPTTAFYDAHRSDIANSTGYAVIDLADDVDDAAFVDAARAIFDDREAAVVQAFESEVPGVQDTVDAQSLALDIGAGVFALAAVVIVGQGTARLVTRTRQDAPVLAALGMTRGERVRAAALSIAPAALGGAALAIVGAALVSPFMPIGLARTIEPERGFDVDVTALLGGAAALAAATLLFASLVWYLDIPPRAERPTWTAALTGALPAPAAYGVSRGLRPTHAVLSRLGTAVGLTGVVAALVFGVTLARLLDTPERYGVPWDAELIVNPNDLGVPTPSRAQLERDEDELASDDDVVDSAVAVYSDGVVLDGITAAAYGIAPGAFVPTIVEGRMATTPDEVALGPGLLDPMGVAVGDTVAAAGVDGDVVALTVVGTVLLPVTGDNGYNNTVALTLDGFEQLASEGPEYRHLLDLRDDVDPAVVLGRHTDVGADGTATERPTEVGNLVSIDGYPWAFAVVFGVMAAGSVSYGITSGVRSSRRDIAVLRAIGFTRRDVRTTVRTWLVADLLAALVVAVVAGAVLGLRGWALLADGLHVAPDGLVPAAGLAAVLAGVLAVAALVSPIVGRVAVAVRPTTALRME